MGEYLYRDITEKIIGCFYRVYNTLGSEYLEKVYETALAHEFGKVGLEFVRQAPIRVFYDGIVAGEYFADFVVGEKVVVEIKAIRVLCGTEEAQLINYLKGTGKRVGLLLNFGEKAKVKRMVFERARGGKICEDE